MRRVIKARRIACGALLTCFLSGCAEEQPLAPRQQADALYSASDWTGAIEACDQLLAESPDDIELLYLRGKSHLAVGRLDDAVSDFTTIIEMTPDDPTGYYYRQTVYQKMGQSELADLDGAKGRSLDPLYQTAYEFEPKNFLPPSPDFVVRKRLADRKESEEEQDDDAIEADSADVGSAEDVSISEDAGDGEPPSMFADQTGSTDSPSDRSLAADDGEGEKLGSSTAATEPPAVPHEPSAPKSPQPPKGPDEPEKGGVAGEGFHEKWMAERELRGLDPEVVVPDEPPLEDPLFSPEKYRRPVTTALPRLGDTPAAVPQHFRKTGIDSRLPVNRVGNSNAAIPTTPWQPGRTGLSSRPPSVTSGLLEGIAPVPRKTGFDSRRPDVSMAPTAAGFQPGIFQSSPLPGSSLSNPPMPGIQPPQAHGATLSGAVEPPQSVRKSPAKEMPPGKRPTTPFAGRVRTPMLSTQLPPERTVKLPVVGPTPSP